MAVLSPFRQQVDSDVSTPNLQPRLGQLCEPSFPPPFGPSPAMHHEVRWLPAAPSTGHQTLCMVQSRHEVVPE